MKIQKILLVLFAALLIIGVPTAGYAQINVSTPETIGGEVGETAVLPISVTDLTGKDITSFEFKVSYDASIVEITGYETESTLSSAMNTVDFNTQADGSVSCAGYGSTALEGKGVLINLNVKYKKGGLTIANISDFYLNDANYSVNPVAVTVGAVDIVLAEVGGDVGDEVTLDVAVDDLTGKEILSYEYTLKYDESIVNIKSMEVAGTLTDELETSFIDLEGQAKGAAFSDTYMSGEGVLFTLTVDLVGQGTSEISFDSFLFNEGTPANTSNKSTAKVGLIDVVLPTTEIKLNDTTLIPITIEDVSSNNVTAFEFQFNYVANNIEVIDVVKENSLSASWIVHNTINDGVCIVGGFHNEKLEAGTELVFLKVAGKLAGETKLSWTEFIFNEGTPGENLVDGTLTVVSGPIAMTIAEAAVDADKDFVPDNLDKEVIVTGVVTTPNYSAGGTDWAIEDGEAGILIYAYSTYTKAVQGDSVRVTGSVDQYRGKTEIKITDSLNVEVLKSGAKIPVPTEVTTLEGFDYEAYENRLITVKKARLLLGDVWITKGENVNIDILVGNDTLTMRIDADTDFDYSIQDLDKIGTLDVTGLLGQFTYDVPANNGYQLLPRYMADFTNINFSPMVAGVVAIDDTKLQIRFSEDVQAPTVDNFELDRGWGKPTSITQPKADVVVITHKAIPVNTPFQVNVSDVKDLTGLTIDRTTVEFKLVDMGDILPIDNVINDFEANIGNWNSDVDFSGSTVGVLGTSSLTLSEESFLEGTKSAKLDIKDDPAEDGGYFIRLLNRKDKIVADSKYYLYLKGTATDVQVRFSIWDNGSGGDGYEVGAWHDITVDEDDWQIIAIDLLYDPVNPWITGNGAINSIDNVTIESIHFQSNKDVDAELYFDLVTERKNLEKVQVALEVDMRSAVRHSSFVPESDFVDVAGSFNGWAGTTCSLVEDHEFDNVYKAKVGEYYPGETLDYKFRINGSWDDDKSEFPGGGANRVFVVGTKDTTVYHWWKDEHPTNAIDGPDAVPTSYALEQNYPNPFNPTTNIRYQLPEDAKVKIVIYDVMGKVVRTLVNDNQSTGYQSVKWDSKNNHGAKVSTGVYIYHMQANSYHQTKKMMLIK